MKKKFVCALFFICLFQGIAFSQESTEKKPFPFSFFTINRYQKSTTDFDETDDTRNFTSEALFAESSSRLNRSLTEKELKNIIRTIDQFETFNDLRFRFDDKFFLDLFYKYKNNKDAQITNFYEPNEFNNVNVNQYGISLSSNFAYESNELFLRGAYKYVDREGTIEFFPEKSDKINEFEVNAMYAKSFYPYKFSIYPTFVFQDIDPDIDNPPTRKRYIAALALTFGDEKKKIYSEKEKDLLKYSDPRPEFNSENIYQRRYDIRVVNLFQVGAGAVYDREIYGNIAVEKFDYFAGATFRLGLNSPIIFRAGPEIFTSTVEKDPSQDNSQFRTNLSLNYQVDNFLFSTPFRHDISIEGPDDFENWRLGFEINYNLLEKWGLISLTAGYYYQDFYELNKQLSLFGISLSIGF